MVDYRHVSFSALTPLPDGEVPEVLAEQIRAQVDRVKADLEASLFGLTNVRGYERYAHSYADWRGVHDMPHDVYTVIDGEFTEIGGLLEGPNGDEKDPRA